MTTTAERVKALVVKQLGIESGITCDATFTELGADSLDRMEIALDIEEEFGLHLTNDEMDHIKTVGQAISLIERRLQVTS